MDDVTVQTSPRPEPEPLLNMDQYGTALMIIAILTTVPSLFGLASNILNICVFSRMRLSHTVTISCFALSISDLGTVVALLMLNVNVVFIVLDLKTGIHIDVDPQTILMLTGDVMEVFLIISTLFTCQLAITRSMCVLLPLRFKEYFTPRKTIVILCLLTVPCFTHLAIYTQVEIIGIKIADNSTRAVLTFRNTYKLATLIFDVLRGPVIILGSEIIVTTCISFMIYSLRRNMTFWMKTKQAGHVNAPHTDIKHDSNAVGGSGLAGTLPKNTSGRKKSSMNATVAVREMQVIAQVTLIATIFVIFKLPIVALLILRYVDRNFILNGLYRKTLVVMSGVRVVFEALSASVNIFVYYRYNTKYRITLRQFLRLKAAEA
ncbi:uncharacterized protein LOC106011271 [Aplysia californica]|uniref:Uncharacterized protein LOC106011271 n=1 Tax=Aplysia californica TaxID=6500 RepID=A0ABM0ZW80_APLCA|nr:uncharacterized protein LOC106011271 [Aplysia californica]